MKLSNTVVTLVSGALLLGSASLCTAQGNVTQQSFSKAKENLEEIYKHRRVSLYCNAKFSQKKEVYTPRGFVSTKYKKRAKKIEWEHVVPAENFGRNFVSWREGHERCMMTGGKPFKGRRCAAKVNEQYRLMRSDMHNLFPAIGSVNALRRNYPFAMITGSESDFGSCDMRIENKKAQPPESSRGRIARATLYMDAAYSKYKLSSSDKQLMHAWDKQYPVSQWECLRAARVAELQGNNNNFVTSRCP